MPNEDEITLADVSDDAVHPVHLVEVTTKDGKVEHHALRVGGAPGMTAEQLAEHINVHDHFKGHAKKIVVKRGGAKAVRGNLKSIIRNPKAAVPQTTVEATVESHPDEAGLFKKKEQLATAEAASPSAPSGANTSVQVAPTDGAGDPEHNTRRVEISGETAKEVVLPDAEAPVADKKVFPQK